MPKTDAAYLRFNTLAVMANDSESKDLSGAFDLLRHHAKTGSVQTKFEIIRFAEELVRTAETEAECLNRIGFAVRSLH